MKITKSLHLDVLPPVLILQLKRFAYDAFYERISKVDTRVSYPLLLTLKSDFLSRELQQNSSSTAYELRAVVLHHGVKATGGHYTALCRQMNSTDEEMNAKGDSRWYLYDDAKITFSEQSSITSHASEVRSSVITLVP